MTTLGKQNTSLPRRSVLALVGALAACPASAMPVRAEAGLADLQVVDRGTGAPLQVWWRNGRTYVAGQPGSPYGLRVINRSPSRILVVLSVDGVNVVTGETAGFNQRGYVIAPFQSHDINGWRKSQSEIAAFDFAPQSRSYATRTGRPFDVGVIGIAVFKERVAPPPPIEALAPDPPPMAVIRPQRQAKAEARSAVEEIVVTGSRVPTDTAAAGSARQERLGTAHGAREHSNAVLVSFERASPQPDLVRRIEYDTYANLVLAGVIPRQSPANRHPRPFPAQNGFVPDPPGDR
jgi:hypothetical protein